MPWRYLSPCLKFVSFSTHKKGATFKDQITISLFQALECVRHSLYHAPNSMRDVPLLSLANIMHRAGDLDSKLIYDYWMGGLQKEEML